MPDISQDAEQAPVRQVELSAEETTGELADTQSPPRKSSIGRIGLLVLSVASLLALLYLVAGKGGAGQVPLDSWQTRVSSWRVQGASGAHTPQVEAASPVQLQNVEPVSMPTNSAADVELPDNNSSYYELPAVDEPAVDYSAGETLDSAELELEHSPTVAEDLDEAPSNSGELEEIAMELEEVAIDLDSTSAGFEKFNLPETDSSDPIEQLLLVDFAFDSSALSAEARLVLDQVVDVMTESGSSIAAITGYSDNRGSEAYNLDLSLRRAEAIAEYLVSRGIARNSLQIAGRGAVKDFVVGTSSPASTDGGGRIVEIRISSSELQMN